MSDNMQLKIRGDSFKEVCCWREGLISSTEVAAGGRLSAAGLLTGAPGFKVS